MLKWLLLSRALKRKHEAQHPNKMPFMLQKTVNMIIPADDATQNFWGFFDHLYAI